MRKWLGRFLAEDREGLMDRSSRPAHSPLALDAGKALTIAEEPGDLIHIDTKKLGRIETTGHRATGNRRDCTRGARWEVLFIAIDGHARIAFTELYSDETQENANLFLANRLGVRPKALLIDNGSAFRSRSFKATYSQIDVKHRFTQPYRPLANGKAERFIQPALHEWA